MFPRQFEHDSEIYFWIYNSDSDRSRDRPACQMAKNRSRSWIFRDKVGSKRSKRILSNLNYYKWYNLKYQLLRIIIIIKFYIIII